MIIKRRMHMTQQNIIDFCKSNHMCAILDKNGNVLVLGYNYYVSSGRTIHAEVDAFNRLYTKFGRMSRKIIINLVVIRTTGGNSKPCDNCQTYIKRMKMNYNIRNIYFSNNNFDIDMIKFTNL